MAIFTGDIKLVGYILTNTLSGSCGGSISSTKISASTSTIPPYLVSWSGTNLGYTASTFDIFNLCPDTYVATLTDATGATATTSIIVSAFTVPTLTASLTNTDCILNPNKLGEIKISEAIVKSRTYKYELRKDNKLIDTYYGYTSDTSHVFSDIKNGMYTVTVVENDIISYTEEESVSQCTPYNFNDNGTQYGWLLQNVIGDTWENYIPNAPLKISFAAGWGPATAGVVKGFEFGLLKDGNVDTNNPFVWFYTGTTKSRMSDIEQDWYLGTSALTKEEGQGWIGPDIPKVVANIGKFYYNSVINKFEYLWPTYTPNISWVTYDPRINYGKPGNPRASDLTGGTSGTTLMNLSPIDVTINSSNVVIAASSIYPEGGYLGKLFSHSNNTLVTGMLSLCSYNNYTWQTSFNATSDDDSMYSILAAFRDDDAKYGPSGVTHSLYIGFNGKSGDIQLGIELGSSAYGLGRDDLSPFRNCLGGSECTTVNPFYGKVTLATFNGSRTPFSAGTTWNARGAVRMKVIRSGRVGEQFDIQFTETMGTGSSATVAVGATNPYVSKYDIDFNLLDKTTWSGNSFSAYNSYKWLGDYDLCKFLGSRKIGYAQISQATTSWYHIQFSGSPAQQNIIAPLCEDLDGPSTTIEITATTGTTANIIKTNNTVSYTSSEPGVPKVKPRVNVSLQTMPLPKLTIIGLSKPNTKLSQDVGGIPSLSVYNTSQGGGTNVQFYYGGDNTDMLFGNMYPKFRIYPYMSELEEIATNPIYEAIFDTLPTIYDVSNQSNMLSGQTFIPWSGFSTGSSWEYIIRPSYLFKDKTSRNEVWSDTTPYPPSKSVNNNTDFYMALVDDPPKPNLLLTDFFIEFTPPQMMIETRVVSGMPDQNNPNSAWSAKSYTHMIRSNHVSMPLVTVNGLVVAEGDSAFTRSTTVYSDPYAVWDNNNGLQPVDDLINVNTKLSTGDYKLSNGNKVVTFFPETVVNGDQLTFMYDSVGGSWGQFFTLPSTVSTVNTKVIYQENGYYYINLDKQSFGAVSLSINGLLQSTYTKVGDSRIQLLSPISTYKEGDVFALFYKTIYTLIGVSMNKEPQIPVTYSKSQTLNDTINVKLFNNNGDLVQHLIEKVPNDEVGGIYRSFKLIPPTPGNYKYRVSIVRQYPLLNGESIYSTSQTELISFEITRDTFYSPSGIAAGNNLNPAGTTPLTRN